MNPIIKHYISAFGMGAVQAHKNMAIVPLMTSLDGGPDYLTLKDALEKALLVVTEVSEGGNVPNLKVANKADVAVLLLDGEELAGAKQNRVLNTTILVKEKSEVVIPVSCTEQGRWSYESREFYDSGNVMSPNLRAMNKRAVATSLRESGEFRSDQGAVWNAVHCMAKDAGTASETGAMKDMYEAKKEDLDAYLKAFSCLPAQKGMLVLIGGEAVGFDFVSRTQAFSTLHAKLVKSYAMEAWIKGRKKAKKAAGEGREAIEKAKAFLDEAAGCEEKDYESVGKGRDLRFTGDKLVGSALAVEEHVVHMAFFRVTEAEKAGHMEGMGRRRSFRI
jgi:hypothetical protein